MMSTHCGDNCGGNFTALIPFLERQKITLKKFWRRIQDWRGADVEGVEPLQQKTVSCFTSELNTIQMDHFWDSDHPRSWFLHLITVFHFKKKVKHSNERPFTVFLSFIAAVLFWCQNQLVVSLHFPLFRRGSEPLHRSAWGTGPRRERIPSWTRRSTHPTSTLAVQFLRVH